MSVQLIGSYIEHEYGYGGYTGKTTNIDEVVATFDNEKDAKRYINDSRLKNPSNEDRRPFKRKSLLSLFEFATIEVGEDDPPPHNPKMGKRSK